MCFRAERHSPCHRGVIIVQYILFRDGCVRHIKTSFRSATRCACTATGNQVPTMSTSINNSLWLALVTAVCACLLTPSLLYSQSQSDRDQGYAWLAGDHHIHSRFSVGWNREVDPPAAIIGGDAIYPIHMNALMAKYFGLSWMVSTDHGGPNHSRINFAKAYPELLQSRQVVPEVLQFYGMEFDTPGADHSSLIIPYSDDEARALQDLESQYAKREPWPANPDWDTEPRMLLALQAMRALRPAPLLIANHPSRSARGLGDYRLDTPAELRRWNDTAPEVAIGMSGAPGHQAATLHPDGLLDVNGWRGGYRFFPTLGGFDQFTARLGGFWDSMIGEGRDWFITANSDSHKHYTEGGSDFWPGEYSKTYVWAQPDHDSILAGIRAGRVFVTTGDLITELYFSIRTQSGQEAGIGDWLSTSGDGELRAHIRFKDPDSHNNIGLNPAVRRVDLIVGEFSFESVDPNSDHNPSTRVLARFSAEDWTVAEGYTQIDFPLPPLESNTYLRLRGTSGEELEPYIDSRGEDPWSDLWFYSNPIRILVRP